MTAYILDTETTGTTDPIEPVEIAYAEFLVDGDGVRSIAIAGYKAKFIKRYKPSVKLTLGAIATHHIIDADLCECEQWNPSAFSLPDDCEYLIGHNVDFDWKVIGSPNVKRICTLALARRVWEDFDSHSLTALQYALREHSAAREVVKGVHSAFHDCMMTGFVLNKIMDVLGCTTLDSLHAHSEKARVPRVMPFGKHKGTPIADVPSDYKSWLLRQPDVDEYLRAALVA